MLDELEQALAHHELVKIKLPATPKHKKKELLHSACDHTGAVAIQLIGRIGIAYRKASKPIIQLP